MVFKNLCVLVLWMKVASALEGLRTRLIFGYCYIIHGDDDDNDDDEYDGDGGGNDDDENDGDDDDGDDDDDDDYYLYPDDSVNDVMQVIFSRWFR